MDAETKFRLELLEEKSVARSAFERSMLEEVTRLGTLIEQRVKVNHRWAHYLFDVAMLGTALSAVYFSTK